MSRKKHIAELMLEYALSLGLTPDMAKAGIWESQIDDRWKITLNGTREEIDSIPRLSWVVELNGWPAGIMSVMGEGILCAGELGNEDALRKAIEHKMKVTA